MTFNETLSSDGFAIGIRIFIPPIPQFGMGLAAVPKPDCGPADVLQGHGPLSILERGGFKLLHAFLRGALAHAGVLRESWGGFGHFTKCFHLFSVTSEYSKSVSAIRAALDEAGLFLFSSVGWFDSREDVWRDVWASNFGPPVSAQSLEWLRQEADRGAEHNQFQTLLRDALRPLEPGASL